MSIEPKKIVTWLKHKRIPVISLVIGVITLITFLIPANQNDVISYRYCDGLSSWEFGTDGTFIQQNTDPLGAAPKSSGTWVWHEGQPIIEWNSDEWISNYPNPEINAILLKGRVLFITSYFSDEYTTVLFRCGQLS